MKISKRQLKRIIREEKSKLIREGQYNSPLEEYSPDGKLMPNAQMVREVLAEVALHFLLKDQNNTGADIYDELMMRLDARGLSTDIDNMLEEL